MRIPYLVVVESSGSPEAVDREMKRHLEFSFRDNCSIARIDVKKLDDDATVFPKKIVKILGKPTT